MVISLKCWIRIRNHWIRIRNIRHFVSSSMLAVCRDEIAVIRQRAGFLYLGRGDLSLAREQLLLGGTDPREVISLYPGSKSLPSSVADPGCLSRIPDPKTATKGRGWKKKFAVIPFFVSHKFHKIENYFIFEMLKKKIWANFQRILEFLPKKLSLSSQKYGFGIRDPKTYSGSRGQKDTGSRIPDPDPQHCFYVPDL